MPTRIGALGSTACSQRMHEPKPGARHQAHTSAHVPHPPSDALKRTAHLAKGRLHGQLLGVARVHAAAGEEGRNGSAHAHSQMAMQPDPLTTLPVSCDVQTESRAEWCARPLPTQTSCKKVQQDTLPPRLQKGSIRRSDH